MNGIPRLRNPVLERDGDGERRKGGREGERERKKKREERKRETTSIPI